MEPNRIIDRAVIRVTSLTEIARLLRRPELDFGCAPLVREDPPGVYHLTLLNGTPDRLARLRQEGCAVDWIEPGGQQDG